MPVPIQNVEDALHLPSAGFGIQNQDRERYPAIDRSEVLVITKLSKFDWDQRTLGMEPSQVLSRPEYQGESGSRILESHYRQLQVCEDLQSYLRPDQIVSIADAPGRSLDGIRLVVALGGDDHFKAVTHFVDRDVCILGVNSDPACSEGNLLGCSAADFDRVLSSIERGECRFEPWTRVRLKVDGVDIGPAVGEVVFAKRDFRLTTRNIVEFSGKKVLQKSSGMIVSTGAGSTGWYAGAGLYLHPEGNPFPRSAPEARFLLREPQVHFAEGKVILPELVEGILQPGAVLTVTSLNNSESIVTRDSIDEVPFNRGSKAEVTIDDRPLWVARPFDASTSIH